MRYAVYNQEYQRELHSDGHITVNKTPKVTGKGQQYFVNKFLSEDEVAG